MRDDDPSPSRLLPTRQFPLFSAQTSSNKPEPYTHIWVGIYKKHVNQNKFARAKGQKRGR